MLLLVGAIVSAYLGYKLLGWWAPAALAIAVSALQAAAYQGVLSGGGGMSGFIQMVALTAAMSLFMFYATFSMGRSLGLRRRRKPR
jgi:hypothetical protein